MSITIDGSPWVVLTFLAMCIALGIIGIVKNNLMLKIERLRATTRGGHDERS